MLLDFKLPEEQRNFIVETFNVDTSDLGSTILFGNINAIGFFFICFFLLCISAIIKFYIDIKKDKMDHNSLMFFFLIIPLLNLAICIYCFSQSKILHFEEVLKSSYIQSLPKDERLFLAKGFRENLIKHNISDVSAFSMSNMFKSLNSLKEEDREQKDFEKNIDKINSFIEKEK